MKKIIAGAVLLLISVSFTNTAYGYNNWGNDRGWGGHGSTSRYSWSNRNGDQVPVSNPTVTPTPTPVPIPPVVTPVTSQVQWGAYVGDADGALSTFESAVGKPVNVYADFEGFNVPFPSYLSGLVGQKSKTLLIYWEPKFGYNQINNGTQDNYIKTFARGAKNYGYSVILVPFDEFNLNEEAWGNTNNGNTPQGFINAWQRVYNIFKSEGATNVKFGLAYNNVSIPSVSFNSFYPGNNYVDYVGVDGFNFGSQNFSQVFSQALSQVQQFGKPVWIFSTGSVTNTSQFIQDLGASHLPFIWFNADEFKLSTPSLLKAIL